MVIKNTGHDGAGRSAAAASMQIHMHRLQNITYHKDFRATGGPVVAGPAVSIGAGVMHGQLYASGSSRGLLAVGGECPTVGAAGGFLQGGGVSSFFSYVHGLAVDNLLELQVVTADVSQPFFDGLGHPFH
jgi:FAD binding domain.